MADNSQHVRKSINFKGQADDSAIESCDLAVDASDSNRLKYNPGTGPESLVLLSELEEEGQLRADNDAALSTSISNATNSLQAQITDVTNDFDAHDAAPTGVHGVTGNVVGTSDTQTLTNKNIAAGSNTITGLTNSNLSGAAGISIANGGTGASTKAGAFDALSPTTTSGDLIYHGAGGSCTRLPIGSNSDILTVSGGVPTWTAPSGVADGSITNAKLASMVAATVKGSASGSGGGAPTDLTAQQVRDIVYSGPTVSIATTGSHSGGFSANGSGTYTTPANVKWIKVTVVGPGGGGQGGWGGGWGTAGNNGSAATTFGSSLLTANAGSGGNISGGAGGTASVSSPAVTVIALTGGTGNGGNLKAANTNMASGFGGSCGRFAGGGAPGRVGGAAGINATANTGGGGSGGGLADASTGAIGAGGGAGGYIEAIITSPASTYSYSIGSGGTGGNTGSISFAGGNGADGLIIVEEYYV